MANMINKDVKRLERIEKGFKSKDKRIIFTGMKPVLHFLTTLIVYAAFDLTYINLIAKKFIHKQVGWPLAPRPDLAAGALFYLIFSAGLLYFCVWPAQTGLRALLNGAFFGLVTYATYELVNKALLDRWPWQLVVADLAWGILAGAVVSWVSWKVGFGLNNWFPE